MKMNWLRLAVLVLAKSVTGADANFASPEVFNVNFYISNNLEVLNASIRDEQAARQHWLQHGIDMGLQASGNFHSTQYLNRYSDLTNAFGAQNYREAVKHYLLFGINERRLGYLEGGYNGRWTVSDNQHRLFVSASRRMGAAVDSLVWNNKEFLNTWDHGRELQMAMNFVPNGECFNPTEAGGRDDSQLGTTHTTIQEVHAAGNQLSTKVLPAYWLQPGHVITESSGSSCQAGMPALNTESTYQHPFSKTVTLDCPGVAQPCLKFTSSFTVAGTIPAYSVLQLEAPTGYLTGDFTNFRSFDRGSGHLVSYDNRKPVVVSTPGDQHAMGV